MNVTATQCCGVQEIYGLSHHGTPEEAMIAMCKAIWGERTAPTDGEYARKPYGLYTFTGVIEHSDGTEVVPNPHYGPRFATFIRKNNLGKVRASTPAPNRVNHPTHIVRLWVWAPDEKHLKGWWMKKLKANPALLAPPVQLKSYYGEVRLPPINGGPINNAGAARGQARPVVPPQGRGEPHG